MEVTFVLSFHLRLFGCICNFLHAEPCFKVLISPVLALGSLAGCSSRLWLYLACTDMEARGGKPALLSCTWVLCWYSNGACNRVWELG